MSPVELIAIVITSIIGSKLFNSGGEKVINYLIEYFKTKLSYKMRNIDNVVKNLVDIIYILEEIIKNTKAQRVTIIRVSNGGGTPTIDKKLYSNLICEANKDLDPIRENWVNVELDEWHVILLQTIINDQYGLISTDTLPKKAKIYSLYKRDNIVGSQVFKILRNKDFTIYASLNYIDDFYDEVRDDFATSENKNYKKIIFIENRINKIKEIFKNNKHLLSQSKK